MDWFDFFDDPILIARFWDKNLAIDYIDFISDQLNTDVFGILYDDEGDCLVVCDHVHVRKFPVLKLFPKLI